MISAFFATFIHFHSDFGVAIVPNVSFTGGNDFGQSAGRRWPRSSISSLGGSRCSVFTSCLNCSRLVVSVGPTVVRMEVIYPESLNKDTFNNSGPLVFIRGH